MKRKSDLEKRFWKEQLWQDKKWVKRHKFQKKRPEDMLTIIRAIAKPEQVSIF